MRGSAGFGLPDRAARAYAETLADQNARLFSEQRSVAQTLQHALAVRQVRARAEAGVVSLGSAPRTTLPAARTVTRSGCSASTLLSGDRSSVTSHTRRTRSLFLPCASLTCRV